MTSHRTQLHPLISVVMPTFNRAHKIHSSIESVLQQSLKNWELLIIDDGSHDDTETVIKNIQQKNAHQRILYIRQTNQGPAIARNTGAENASADLITYLDSDDHFYSSALEDIVHVCKNDQVSYGITNHNRTLCFIDNSGQEISKKFDISGLNKNVTLQQIYNWEIKTTSSGLFHMKRFFTEGIRWRSGFWIEDLDFMLQLAEKEPTGFTHIVKILVDYTQTYGADGLCSNATYADWATAFKNIYELHKKDTLMQNPRVYLDRVEKYKRLHAEAVAGKIPPPQYKFFPELYSDRQILKT